MISDRSGAARCIAPGRTGAPKSARYDAESGGGGVPGLSRRPTRQTTVRPETEIAWRFDIDARNFGAGKPYGKCQIKLDHSVEAGHRVCMTGQVNVTAPSVGLST